MGMKGRERPFLKIQGFEADIPWWSKLDFEHEKTPSEYTRKF